MVRHLPPTAVQFTFPRLPRAADPLDAEGQFRAALSQTLAGKPCFVASSGRTALYLLLKALADNPARREVVLPAYTCPALVKVILDAGLCPRAVDISPQTLEFDRDRLTTAVGDPTLAVIAVHPFGLPQSLEPVQAITRSAGAFLIEDAAQAMGAQWDGQPVGTMGDFGLFSLGPGKALSTGGGGILSVNQPAYLSRIDQAWTGLGPSRPLMSSLALIRFLLLSLAFHPVGWWLATRLGLPQIGNHEAGWGYSLSRLTSTQAQIGLASLGRLTANNQRRRDNAQHLIAALDPLDFVTIPPAPPPARPIYLRLPLILADPPLREALWQRLRAAGIGAGRMYERPLSALFPEIEPETFPGAAQVAERLLTLPTHHYLTAVDMAKMVELLRLK